MKQTGITNKPAKPVKLAPTAITTQPAAASAVRDELAPSPKPRKEAHPLWRALEVAASLRITVWLFVLSLILVFYGTWAQKDAGVWTVVSDYFRSALVWIPLHVLLMHAIEPESFYIPFPGGWLLGGVLLVNLLAAHIVRFKLSWKRSGILLIHAGIVIMMLGELITGLYQVEGRMNIREGQTVNYVELDRVAELAVIDSSAAKADDVVSVPGSRLREGATISDSLLPFDIEVKQFMVNSKLGEPTKDAKNSADTGYGLARIAVPEKEVSGTDTRQTVDLPAAYITLYDKTTLQPIGTFLVTYHFIGLEPQEITVGGKRYEFELRPRRVYYDDLKMKLVKFRFDRYPGTKTARNYQSDVVLFDSKTPKDGRKVTISMNNPLRYGGETFYQASFSPDEQGTVLQVVRNPGWLMPYISCIVVTLGMLVHFGINLISFLQKRTA